MGVEVIEFAPPPAKKQKKEHVTTPEAKTEPAEEKCPLPTEVTREMTIDVEVPAEEVMMVDVPEEIAKTATRKGTKRNRNKKN